MKKLKRSQAKKLYLGGLKIWLCPSKYYPAKLNHFNISLETWTTPREVHENKYREVPQCQFENLVNGYAYYSCTEETGRRVNFYREGPTKPKIVFIGDHAQYLIPGRLDGYEAPIIGLGANEVDAYRDALNSVENDLHTTLLPKRAGSKRRGYAHYFGRDVAKEIRANDENEMHVYCLIYIPA